jgi:hypothetical protein
MEPPVQQGSEIETTQQQEDVAVAAGTRRDDGGLDLGNAALRQGRTE